ncbi:hypothetical protein [Nocardia sp. NPDC005366]|uniref:hypothetical protein n=1 Tax=Nocardia sp. NPDC005366 TaxID=3156878 RepID=UPI0033B2F9B5
MYWHDGMYGHGDAMNGWMFVLVMFALIPLWIALVAGVVMVLRGVDRPERRQSAKSGNEPLGTEKRTPAEILALRFADGQLDETEYLRRLSVLNRGGSGSSSSGSSSAATSSQA